MHIYISHLHVYWTLKKYGKNWHSLYSSTNICLTETKVYSELHHVSCRIKVMNTRKNLSQYSIGYDGIY